VTASAVHALYCENGKPSFSKMQAVWWTVVATVYVFTADKVDTLVLSSMLAFPLAALGVRRLQGPKE
jgi:hypothetical protein